MNVHVTAHVVVGPQVGPLFASIWLIVDPSLFGCLAEWRKTGSGCACHGGRFVSGVSDFAWTLAPSHQRSLRRSQNTISRFISQTPPRPAFRASDQICQKANLTPAQISIMIWDRIDFISNCHSPRRPWKGDTSPDAAGVS